MTVTREQNLEALRAGAAPFDVIVVGGGITGAGVAREAAGSGLRTLLVEQKDFTWGTSSRSSKMVHGGLRYLGSGQFGLTQDAVQERQRLMAEAPGLIEPLRFVLPHYHRQFPGPRMFQMLLRVYDRIARVRSRRLLTAGESLQWVPGLAQDRLMGASVFTDAVTDDARLVLRILAEARRDGALCLNYVKALEVQRDTEGQVTGLQIQPEESDSPMTVAGRLVINATGAWAGELQQNADDRQTIRPLRGSHLVLPWKRLPVSCSVSLLHPDDRRPVFAFPWQGTTVLGTTDLDHRESLDQEPAISQPEVDYLLRICARLFPGSDISAKDILSTWAGVRPVVSDGGPKAPSKENREHQLWNDKGLISIAGGKLTTFRLIAREALYDGLEPSGSARLRDEDRPVFAAQPPAPRPTGISHLTWQRLQGYYGPELTEVLAAGDHQSVCADPAVCDLLWTELAWACGHEDVRHLDDLLLRRTRLGLILPDGAQVLMPDLKQRLQPVLGWTDDQWRREADRYRAIWQQAYSLPLPATEEAER